MSFSTSLAITYIWIKALQAANVAVGSFFNASRIKIYFVVSVILIIVSSVSDLTASIATGLCKKKKTR